jgi:2-oxoglutarate ferredoxin oxidoreductase subunit alpha
MGSDSQTKRSEVRFAQGNEACVAAALKAGVRFFAGYPITPSSEIAEGMALRLPLVGGKFIQMEDEIGSMAAVCGASLAGLKAMTATSGPGFSLKQENIGFACLCEIPCVIVNVQRGDPSTGLPTSPMQGDMMQARWGTHGDHPAVAFAPSSVREMFDLTVKAVNVSERLRTPAMLLADEVVAHMREKLEIPETVETVDRAGPTMSPEEYLPYAPDPETLVPPMAAFGRGYRYHVSGLMHDETGFPSADPDNTQALLERLMAKVERVQDEITLYEAYDLDDARIALVAYGSSARVALRSARDARAEGVPAGILRIKTIWPFPDAVVGEVCAQADAVIVPEMNLGQIVHEVRRVAAGRCEVIPVNQANGELFQPATILEAIHHAAAPRLRPAGLAKAR